MFCARPHSPLQTCTNKNFKKQNKTKQEQPEGRTSARFQERSLTCGCGREGLGRSVPPGRASGSPRSGPRSDSLRGGRGGRRPGREGSRRVRSTRPPTIAVRARRQPGESLGRRSGSRAAGKRKQQPEKCPPRHAPFVPAASANRRAPRLANRMRLFRAGRAPLREPRCEAPAPTCPEKRGKAVCTC